MSLPSQTTTPSTSALTIPPTWIDRGRIPCLDGLRALAILLVVYSHGHYPGDRFPLVHMLKGRCGFLGVQIFFVLSGFLITTLMLREVERTGRVHLGHFYLRRALRIIPVYATYLLLLAILDACGAARFDGRQWLAAATYTVNFLPSPLPSAMSHLWSLCVEEHFYLIWPLLMALLPPRWCVRAIPVCLAMSFLIRWFLLTRSYGSIDLLTFTRIDDIAVGCGLAYLARSEFARRCLDRFVTFRRLTLLFGLFVASQVCLSRAVGSILLPSSLLPFGIALANDINTLTIAVLMWAGVNNSGSFWHRLLNHPAPVYLGVLSYSIYLWHVLLCEREEPAWLCAFPQNLFFIFVAATLSYRSIEAPFLAWKDRFAGGRSPEHLDGFRIGRLVGGTRAKIEAMNDSVGKSDDGIIGQRTQPERDRRTIET
jgi:peptidoglycan/LPS O-acetylase OafA/YrhL